MTTKLFNSCFWAFLFTCFLVFSCNKEDDIIPEEQEAVTDTLFTFNNLIKGTGETDKATYIIITDENNKLVGFIEAGLYTPTSHIVVDSLYSKETKFNLHILRINEYRPEQLTSYMGVDPGTYFLPNKRYTDPPDWEVKTTIILDTMPSYTTYFMEHLLMVSDASHHNKRQDFLGMFFTDRGSVPVTVDMGSMGKDAVFYYYYHYNGKVRYFLIEGIDEPGSYELSLSQGSTNMKEAAITVEHLDPGFYIATGYWPLVVDYRTERGNNRQIILNLNRDPQLGPSRKVNYYMPLKEGISGNLSGYINVYNSDKPGYEWTFLDKIQNSLDPLGGELSLRISKGGLVELENGITEAEELMISLNGKNYHWYVSIQGAAGVLKLEFPPIPEDILKKHPTIALDYLISEENTSGNGAWAMINALDGGITYKERIESLFSEEKLNVPGRWKQVARRRYSEGEEFIF